MLQQLLLGRYFFNTTPTFTQIASTSGDDNNAPRKPLATTLIVPDTNTVPESVYSWNDKNRDLPAFEDLIVGGSSAVIISDGQLKKRGQHARAQLRSLPLFRDYGFETVVHTDVWSDRFKLIDYTHVPTPETTDEIDDLELPLVHLVTQEGITEYGEEAVIWELLNRAVNQEERYILVTDTVSPRLPREISKAGKSIPDYFASVGVMEYEPLSKRYIGHFESALPLADTRNPYFHRVSEYHDQHDAPAGSLDELFDYTKAPSKSPVWEPLYYFIKHDLDAVLDDLSERIREALRSWIERGETQRIASRMYDTMSNVHFEIDQLEDYRKREPSKR